MSKFYIEDLRTCNYVLNEFKLQNIRLKTSDWSTYGTSMVMRYQPFYMSYRLAWILFWNITVITMLLHEATRRPRSWYTDVQNLQLIFTSIDAIVRLTSAVQYFMKGGDKCRTFQIDAVLTNIVCNSTISWAILGVYSLMNEGHTWYLIFQDIFSISYILAEVCLSSFPIRLLHVWHSQVVMPPYLAILYIYFWKTGSFANPFFNFKNVNYVIVSSIFATFVLMPVVQFLLFAIHWGILLLAAEYIPNNGAKSAYSTDSTNISSSSCTPYCEESFVKKQEAKYVGAVWKNGTLINPVPKHNNSDLEYDDNSIAKPKYRDVRGDSIFSTESEINEVMIARIDISEFTELQVCKDNPANNETADPDCKG